MTLRNPSTQNQHQPQPTSPEDVENMFCLGDRDGSLTTPQEHSGGEFYLHLHELKEFTENPSWLENPQILADMKAKLGEVNEKFDELFWFSRREIVKAEIEAYLPSLDWFIRDHALGLKPSVIVGRILKDAEGGEEGEWHEGHDRDLIFRTWDTLTPLIRNLEAGWLKYLPRAKSPTRLTNPPIAGEITVSHPDGLAVAMREEYCSEYKGDLYKASLSHFLDGHGGIEAAKRDVRKAKAILVELKGSIRMGDSRAVVEVLFSAEKKLLAETEGFLKEEGVGVLGRESRNEFGVGVIELGFW